MEYFALDPVRFFAPHYHPNQVYNAQRSCSRPYPPRQDTWPGAPRLAWAEKVLSHVPQGRPGLCAWAGEWATPRCMQPSHPGPDHPQSPAHPGTPLGGGWASRPPHSARLPAPGSPRAGQGTLTPASWASACCLGTPYFSSSGTV